MATKKITMPKLGESVTEGTINSWLVKVGDIVNKYDPIAEVMTDKVNAEVPSSYAGVIKEIVCEEGDAIAVGELICYIETDEEHEQDSKPVEQVKSLGEHHEREKEEGKDGTSMRARYSPAVVRLASEHDIDLHSVEGTGLGGRITRKDVQAYLNSKKIDPAPRKERKEKKQHTSYALNGQDREISVTGVRKIIAENMTHSKQEIPHAWMMVEVDVTDLVSYRNKIKNEFKDREGYSLTYFSFFVYAISRALKEFPEMNSMWAGDKIIQRHDINISIAVAKENELFVPVIKGANEKSITGIAKDISQLAAKARSNQLDPSDMEGGTFTVNNTGTFGSISSMGIINHPQAAILQVESIVKRPVIINNMFAARDIVNLSLSLDHRVLDGLICGRFLARVKELLENMNEKNTTI